MTTAADTNQQRRERILIVIPAYNEAGSICGVLDDLDAHVPSADVVIVDDGSSDNTAAIAESMGAVALRLPCNLGIGGALRTGYLYAYENGYDVAIQFDGDGQHRADQIQWLLAGLSDAGADMVIGSRMLSQASYPFPFMRRIGSKLIGAITFLVTGRRITDPTSGFRAYNRRAIAFFSRHYPQSYLDSSEITVWAAKQGMNICEMPTEMRPAEHSSVGSIIGVLHTLRMCLAILIDRMEKRFPEQPPVPDSVREDRP